jgi:hypothetical protein
MTIEIKNSVAIIESGELLIDNVQSALDLMASVEYETGCKSIALPKEAVAEEFFALSTGLAGDILQKIVTYHVKLAIIGDFSHYTSKPLHDFIYESNKGHHVFFVGTQEEALAKLGRGVE